MSYINYYIYNIYLYNVYILYILYICYGGDNICDLTLALCIGPTSENRHSNSILVKTRTGLMPQNVLCVPTCKGHHM